MGMVAIYVDRFTVALPTYVKVAGSAHHLVPWCLEMEPYGKAKRYVHGTIHVFY